MNEFKRGDKVELTKAYQTVIGFGGHVETVAPGPATVQTVAVDGSVLIRKGLTSIYVSAADLEKK